MLGIRLQSIGLLLLALACFSDGAGVESIDVLEPIAKISPAKRAGMTDDSFGYSIAVHQLFESPANMSLEEILGQTLIMVGAPHGAYPGGLSTTEVPPSNLSCSGFHITTDNVTEILECYSLNNPNGTHNRTGLVYQCSLSSGSCTATLGNGDPREPDGLLFDRVGNIDRYTVEISNNFRDTFFAQNKNGQQMGATVYSEEGYFVACAPLWEYTDLPTNDNSQPRGQCVYSGRNLTNFLRLNPCYRNGRDNNQIGEGFCEAGFSVGITASLASTSSFEFTGPVLMTGSPGRDASSGGVYYYNPLGTPTLTFNATSEGRRELTVYDPSIGVELDPSLLGQAALVNASNSGDMISGINNPPNVPVNKFSYFGFAISSGYITNRTIKDAVVSAPKYNRTTQVGRVYIVTNVTQLPTLFLDGDQFGEQFGYSVAVTDLNGDGWDDILVGAPIYADPNRQHVESGRVAIYRNDGTGTGSFTYTGSIFGQSSGSRFGMSIATLGDINNDGYNDFAVGAPFEGDGVVYVYHGQNVNGSIVNTTIQQVINGTEVAGQVTNLTSGVKSFGFSLSGTTDVDRNEYRDLVVGAFESQTVFVLRSIPVAITNISFAANVTRVALGLFNCSFDGDPQNTCFQVTIRSSYTGRGLSSGFSTYYQLEEVPGFGAPPRLFFDNPSRSFIRRQITYPQPNETVFDNIVVYVKNTTDFSDFILRVRLEQIQRDSTTVNTNVPITTSFSQSPVIQSQFFEQRIPVVRNCGPDGVCISDLVTNVASVDYTSEDNTRYDNVSVGLVTRVTLNVEVWNLGEDSYNPFLNITFPKEYFTFVPTNFLPAEQCNNTSPSDSPDTTIICTNSLPSIFTTASGNVTRQVRLDVSNSLIGNESSLPVQIRVNNTDEIYSREDNNGNNDIQSNLEVVATSVYVTEIQWSLREIDYRNTGSSFSNNVASTLGPGLNITASVRIEEGAPISSGKLTIYVPATTPDLGNNYYFYPARILNVSSGVTCNDSGLNPRSFTLSTAQMGSQRRSIDSDSEKEHSTRRKRQTTAGLACTPTDTTGCIPVVCSFSSLSREINIKLTGYLDERFFNGKTATYNLTTFARVDVTDGFTITSMRSSTEASSIISLIGPPEETPSSGIPWYIIVAPILAAIIFFIIVVVLLYFLGFFRRKRHGKAEITGEDEEFEQFAPNPFGAGAGGGGGGGPPAPPKDEEKS